MSDRFKCSIFASVNTTFYLKSPEKLSSKKFSIKIVDISSTGIMFVTDRLLAVDECFYFDLFIKGKREKMCCTVVRIAEISEKLIYGAKFINPNPSSKKEENEIKEEIKQ